MNKKLPLYYSPKYNGFHVIYEKGKYTSVIGGCCTFVSDAYTNIVRHKVSNEYINSLIRINKRKLNTYEFVQKGTKHLPKSYLATETIKAAVYLMCEDALVLSTEYKDFIKTF